MKSQFSNFQRKGFTLIELVMVIVILITLTALAVPAFRFFQKESDLNNSAEEIINTLRLAQNKTLASEEASQWGVYFLDSTDPHQFILFKGSDFISRESEFDEIHKLPLSVEIYEINLENENSEVVFNRLTGKTDQFGEVLIRLKIDLTKTKTIYIENSGLISLALSETIFDEDRIKDSRRVHFDYSRFISTSEEKLTLIFTDETSTVTWEVIIADHLKDGQIFWEGNIDVEGEIQEIKIHTHRLNDPDSQFCVHRDRRYNNKALTITISGDDTGYPSGELIQYDALGDEAQGSSIYVGEPQRQ